MAHCEWRAAAPGLKPLRLPRAQYNARKQLLDFCARVAHSVQTSNARSTFFRSLREKSRLKSQKNQWDNLLPAPILLLPAPAYGEPSLEKFLSAAPILLPSLRSSQVLGGQSFEKFTSLKLTGAVARDHSLLAGDPGRVVTVGRVRCLFNKYKRQIHT